MHGYVGSGVGCEEDGKEAGDKATCDGVASKRATSGGGGGGGW